VAEGIATRYAAALTRHLEQRDEVALLAAYDIGREAVGGGDGVLDLVVAHHEAMARAVAGGGDASRSQVECAGELMLEALGPFEMAFRGFQESNAGLARARAEAERANRAKDEFLSRTSHELRTPLNAILGFGQLLELDPLEPRQAEAVSHILSAGRHLLELINDLLDISRIEAGSLSLSIEPVLMAEVADGALALMRPLADDRGVTVTFDDGSAGQAYVFADRQRLKQVLLNLLSNGIKYNRPNGSVTVTCSQRPENKLRITVTDTGGGFDASDMDRVFAPFDRLDAGASEVEGIGLGLSLSRNLVHAMGGDIGVVSELGQGSRFWVDLPVAESPLAGHDRPDQDKQLPRTEVKTTILYIEDNLSNLKLIDRLLTRWRRISLLTAMQGQMGIDLARRHRPDLILLDLHLPDMDGTRALREILADPRTRDIPVVVISADATPGQVERFRALGARAYLPKPLQVSEFLETLDEMVPGAARPAD
jgi:signal transduction histidine kinase/ActR/RegA family two-component response regulator